MNNGTIWSFERTLENPFDENLEKLIVVYILELRSIDNELWVRYSFSPPKENDSPSKGFTSTFKDFSIIFTQNLKLSFL